MRRLVLLVVVVAAIGAAYVLGTKHTSNPATSSSTTSSSVATSTSTSTTSSTSTSTTAPTASCTGDALTGTAVAVGGATGTIELDLVLTNTGAAPCSLVGYPSLLLRAASGMALPTVRVLGGVTFTDSGANAGVHTVTLPVGTAARVAIKYSDVTTGSACPTATSVEVTIPKATTAVPIMAILAPCGGGRLYVSPFYLSPR